MGIGSPPCLTATGVGFPRVILTRGVFRRPWEGDGQNLAVSWKKNRLPSFALEPLPARSSSSGLGRVDEGSFPASLLQDASGIGGHIPPISHLDFS